MPKVLSKYSKKSVYAKVIKSPLKWAGGKRKLIEDIANLLPKHKQNRNSTDNTSILGQRLIEPFVGGGSVFLNLAFSDYLLCDSNPDLIHFFQHVKSNSNAFIFATKPLFCNEYNNAEAYYKLRSEFNNTPPSLRRSVLFLYLNRHGYNGLCRYNLKGGYNVPFGQYKKPYFPEEELTLFANKATQATFALGDFSLAFEKATSGDIIYCDPPYSPINLTANFTAYSGIGFLHEDQQRLAKHAECASKKGITTIISNNDLPITRELYSNANKIVSLNVSRTISCKGNIRRPCKELMALYKAE